MYVHVLIYYIIKILKYLNVFNKKFLTCIPLKHKSLWQLSQLNDFTINEIANLIHERFQRRIQNPAKHLRWSFIQE